MANLFVESSLNSSCCTGGGLKTATSKAEYIKKVKNGDISKDQFAHDSIDFGLAKWRYWSRKEAFYDFCKEFNYAIDDTRGQLEYIFRDVKKNYKTLDGILTNAASVREASDAFMKRYEKPANMTEEASKKREKIGIEYLEAFVDKEKYVVTTKDKVNLRCGNGSTYDGVIQIAKKGSKFKWVATAENGWHALSVTVPAWKGKYRVLWITPDCSEIQSG